jgi:von Willebrand factor type A domain
LKKLFTTFNFKTILRNLCLIIGLVLLHITAANAQKKTRILFLIDASSSMSYPWSGADNRFQAAGRVVLGIMDSMYAINNEIEFAVRVYGADYPSQEKNCVDTKLEVPFNLQNMSQIKNRLKYITPRGSSPIAYSLQQAFENELGNSTKYDYSFVLITDGGETCGGDICDIYKKMLKQNIAVSPYIVGLDSNVNLIKFYECLGQYVGVAGPKDIATAVQLIVNNNRKIIDKPKALNLKTQFSGNAPLEKPIVKPFEAYAESLEFVPFIKHTLELDFTKTFTAPKIKGYLKNYIPSLAIPELTKDNLTAMISLAAREFKVKTTVALARKLKLPKLPKVPNNLTEELEKEPLEMQALAIGNTKVLNAKNDLFAGRKLKLPKLPKVPNNLTEELEKEPLEIQAMAIGNTKVLSTKNGLYTGKKLKLPKLPKVPNDLTEEPEKEALVLQQMPHTSIRSKNFSVQPIKRAKNFNLVKNSLPPDYIAIPQEEVVPMKTIYTIPFRMNYMYGSSYSGKPAYRKVGPAKIPEAMLVVKGKPTIKPVIAQTPEAPTEFKVISEPSSETKVTVYFTDGNGKYYKTKPYVNILNAGTQTLVKKFMRDILPGTSEPEPVIIDFQGNFDFVIVGTQKDISAKNIPIIKNTNNKVYIKVSNGTLTFSYQNAPLRPVNHKVTVFRRFGDKHITPVAMMGTDLKMFEPGDYYVELDILPSYAVATEISFGAQTEIQIPQEGLMTITNTQDFGEVTLSYEHGDQYETFKTMNINGDVANQTLYLRPGAYRAQFKDPKFPKFTAPTTLQFLIRANTETKIELRDTKGQVVTPDGTGKPIYNNEPATIKIINK